MFCRAAIQYSRGRRRASHTAWHQLADAAVHHRMLMCPVCKLCEHSIHGPASIALLPQTLSG